ncbi:MAG: hypothetical protein RRA92_01680 [Gemmatimonadota bacterium]|nr:hypothetical protein [Gemmatimonadota bacterium]
MKERTGLIGMRESELTARLGAPVSRRSAGGDVWLVYTSGDLSLRVRCESPDAGEPRVASWTASFDPGFETLSDAARAVGLWPVAAPDAAAAETHVPLLRRPLPCPATGTVCSLTATVRAGRVTQISVFDEEPDWG